MVNLTHSVLLGNTCTSKYVEFTLKKRIECIVHKPLEKNLPIVIYFLFS